MGSSCCLVESIPVGLLLRILLYKYITCRFWYKLPPLEAIPNAPPFTAQARELRSRLAQQLSTHGGGGDVLWVISPLRRALQTFMEACPLLHPPSGSGGAPTLPLASGSAGGIPTPMLSAAAALSSSSPFFTFASASTATTPLLLEGPPPPLINGAATAAVAGEAVRKVPVIKVEILPLISEFLVTAGDVGSAASELAKEFPAVGLGA